MGASRMIHQTSFWNTASTDVATLMNGLAFSPDESLLYVSDTAAALPGHGSEHCIHVFDVVDGVRLARGRVFAEIAPGVPDGFRVDRDGRLYTSAADGVQEGMRGGARRHRHPPTPGRARRRAG